MLCVLGVIFAYLESDLAVCTGPCGTACACAALLCRRGGPREPSLDNPLPVGNAVAGSSKLLVAVTQSLHAGSSPQISGGADSNG